MESAHDEPASSYSRPDRPGPSAARPARAADTGPYANPETALVQSVFRSAARRSSATNANECEFAALVTEKRIGLNRGPDASPMGIEGYRRVAEWREIGQVGRTGDEWCASATRITGQMGVTDVARRESRRGRVPRDARGI